MFTGKYTTRKIHRKLHPGLEWRIFRILTSEDIDDFSDILISSLSLNRYLNSLVYDRVFLESLRQSSKIFGKYSGTFVWPSEPFWKIFRNLLKVVGNLGKIVKTAVISMST